jgi:hypothetical protein
MTDEMHRSGRAPHNRFEYLCLVGNIGIQGGAALSCPTISEQARCHTTEAAIPL